MIKIKATFKGADGSMGFQHGKEYELRLSEHNGGIEIKDLYSGCWCPYSGIIAFLNNWDNITAL